MAVKYTEEQLNTFDKSFVIELLLAEQEQTEKLTWEISVLTEKIISIDQKDVVSF